MAGQNNVSFPYFTSQLSRDLPSYSVVVLCTYLVTNDMQWPIGLLFAEIVIKNFNSKLLVVPSRAMLQLKLLWSPTNLDLSLSNSVLDLKPGDLEFKTHSVC